MTHEEAIKILSAFCNGFQYPFGKGFLENCDMKEVDRHAILLDDALKKNIPQRPILENEQHVRYTMCYECPACKRRFTGTGIANYCYHCGQALSWEEI